MCLKQVKTRGVNYDDGNIIVVENTFGMLDFITIVTQLIFYLPKMGTLAHFTSQTLIPYPQGLGTFSWPSFKDINLLRTIAIFSLLSKFDVYFTFLTSGERVSYKNIKIVSLLSLFAFSDSCNFSQQQF